MAIKGNQLKEKEDYQRLILDYLEEQNGYRIRESRSYHHGFAMDADLLMEFLYTTQPETMEKVERHYRHNTQEIILNSINNEVLNASRGLCDVLLEGVDLDSGIHLDLFYRKPETSINTKAVKHYEQNIFSVMQEVYYKENSGDRVDLVIFVNGFAIFAVELKCNTSGQDVEYGIKQYKKDRDPSTRLFKSRCGVLAAFAMDLNEVYYTTELKGQNTFFNPFNKGNSHGKGNPHNPDGINVSYMWEDIWTKDSIAFLLERIIYIKTRTTKNPDTGRTKTSKQLIFPRYHQLRAVRAVLADVREHGSSSNYLIEHSAGSGKTETISWLAHTLATVHNASDKNIFDTVLVITDRIVVDRQLQEAIQGIPHKFGQVKVMGDNSHSSDLAAALEGNTKIIVTTIHKFFYILQQNYLGKMKQKNFSVIIDEAHSSTHGSLMQAVTTVLSNHENNEDDMEAQIIEEIQKCGKQDNVSMIAFTATPKPETLQLFGQLNMEGKRTSFDLYSMKQAIEEGYILNVLDNYMIWKTYFEINKIIDEDPELDSIAAKRKIARFINLQNENIQQKSEIIIEHFVNNVMHLLGGTAKAMVVTSSREAAVRYHQEFKKYIDNHNYQGIGALVAFSGKVKIEEEEFTEEAINLFPEEKLREEFDDKQYQVLIVANKYQTGFDQPKLVALYIDKKLHGVTAVQTLSRLNRICPPYNKSTFVLDFKNTYEDIQAAFAPYYEDTILSETISPADVRELSKAIYNYNVLDADDIETFNSFLYQDKRTHRDKEKMWTLLDKAVRAIDQEEPIHQDEIAGTMRKFLKAYLFIIQATCYENIELHKLYNFLSYLVKELTPNSSGNDFNIADKIAIRNIHQKEVEHHTSGSNNIEAKPDVQVPKPMPVSKAEQIKKALSAIIEEINNLYNKQYEVESTVKAAEQIKDLLINSPDVSTKLKESAKSNSLDEFKYTYDECIEDTLTEALNQNQDFFTLLLDTKDLRDKLTKIFIEDVYDELRNK